MKTVIWGEVSETHRAEYIRRLHSSFSKTGEDEGKEVAVCIAKDGGQSL